MLENSPRSSRVFGLRDISKNKRRFLLTLDQSNCSNLEVDSGAGIINICVEEHFYILAEFLKKIKILTCRICGNTWSSITNLPCNQIILYGCVHFIRVYSC